MATNTAVTLSTPTPPPTDGVGPQDAQPLRQLGHWEQLGCSEGAFSTACLLRCDLETL